MRQKKNVDGLDVQGVCIDTHTHTHTHTHVSPVQDIIWIIAVVITNDAHSA